MAVAMPAEGLLTTTLTANTVLKVNLLDADKFPLILLNPASGVTASLSWSGTDGATGAPTHYMPAVGDCPIPRAANGVHLTAVYLYSLAGGVVSLAQYPSPRMV
jgi:hypothetical protein